VLRREVPLISVALVLAACSGSSSPKATVTPPADALAALAAQGASAVYAATYAFHQISPDTTATVKVWRAEPSFRVDVVAGTTTATLLLTPAGSYSCSISGAKRSCLLVAASGAPVPAPFDVAPANLFSADLHTLATDTAAYDVRTAPARPTDSNPRRPAGPIGARSALRYKYPPTIAPVAGFASRSAPSKTKAKRGSKQST